MTTILETRGIEALWINKFMQKQRRPPSKRDHPEDFRYWDIGEGRDGSAPIYNDNQAEDKVVHSLLIENLTTPR